MLRICAKHGVPLPGSDPELRVYRLLLDNGRVPLLVAALRRISFFRLVLSPHLTARRGFPLPLKTPEYLFAETQSLRLCFPSADGIVLK